MIRARIDEMERGWFVGDFEPSVLRTNAAEVGVKCYKAGDKEGSHHHKSATEVTLIISGHARMNGVDLVEGDIVRLEPGEVADFQAMSDVTTVVVKVPSVKGDKYSNE